MGKGARTREANAFEVSKQREQRIKKEKYIKIRKRIICSVIAILVVAGGCGIALAVRNNIRENNKWYYHNTVAVKSKNFELTAAQMSYFYNMQIVNFQNNYADAMSQIQIDTSKSLKNQACDANFAQQEGQTWFEYFYDLAEKQATQTLAMVERAKLESFELSNEDKDIIASSVESMTDVAAEYNMELQEYLDYVYGEGTTIQEVQTAMEYYQISSKLFEKNFNSSEYTKTQIDSHYNSNKKLFTSVDYIVYPFSVSISSYGGDKFALTAAKEAVKKRADSVISAKTPDEFKALLIAHLTDYNKGNKDMTADKIKETVNSAVMTDAMYVKDDQISEWLFSDSTMVGDLKVFEKEENGIYTMSVAMLTSAMEPNEDKTRDIRHILISSETNGGMEGAKKKADEILGTYNKGDKSEQSFSNLAKKYSEDPGSQANGGLYEGVSKGQMVENFDAWMFDTARKKGDTGIVESSYGYHIMYYPAVEKTVWESLVRTALINQAYEKSVEGDISLFSVETKNIETVKEQLDY